MSLNTCFNAKCVTPLWQVRGIANAVFHTGPSLSESSPYAQFFQKLMGVI